MQSEQKFTLGATVRCGDCKHFVRDGKCRWYDTPESKAKGRPFSHAPFWVRSDCYSDKEQVRSDITSACPTFVATASPSTVEGE